MKDLKTKILNGFLWVVALSPISETLAQIIPDSINTAAESYSINLTHIPKFFFAYAAGGLKWAGGFAILFVTIGGIQYVLGGMTDNKEQGKKTIIYAVTGTILVVMAWFLVDFIVQFMTE